MKKKRYFGRFTLTLLAAFFALWFLLPTVLTISNSFMTQSEISANYGKVFANVSGSDGKAYIADSVNLKFIPDKVTFNQYLAVLLRSPDYLLKFWNSVILVVPIVLLQLVVASITAYGFTRWRGKVRSFLFFFYVILMLMPTQVTLVPNYLVSDWVGLLNTRWAIILPGAFAPFSVFLLTKSMRRIPAALIEAAKLDGSSEWQIFKDICLPQRTVLHRDSGVYRLLEHGGAAHHPAPRCEQAAAERLPVHHQHQRGRPGLCHRYDLHGSLPPAVPPW